MSARTRRSAGARRRMRTAATGGFQPVDPYANSRTGSSGGMRNQAFVVPKRVVGGRISPDMAMFNHLELERELLKKQAGGADDFEEKAPRAEQRAQAGAGGAPRPATASAAQRNAQVHTAGAAPPTTAAGGGAGAPGMAQMAQMARRPAPPQVPRQPVRMPGPIGRREPVEDIKDAARHVSLVPVRYRGGGREPPEEMQAVRQPPPQPPVQGRMPAPPVDPRMAMRGQYPTQPLPPGGRGSSRDYHSRISSADYQRLLRASLQNYYQQHQQYPHQYHRNLSQSLAYRLGKQTASRHAGGAYEEPYVGRPPAMAPSYAAPPMHRGPPRRGRYGADGMWYPAAEYEPYPPQGYPRRHPRGPPVAMYAEPPTGASYASAGDRPLRKQIEYYFSDDNLANDDYLQGLMDTDGWVKARFLEHFPRVRKMKASAAQILDACSSSRVLEVNNRRIRRRTDWEKFLPDPENVSRRILEAMATKIEDRWLKMQKMQQQTGEDQKDEEKKDEEPAGAGAGAAAVLADEEAKEALQAVEDKKETEPSVQVNGRVEPDTREDEANADDSDGQGDIVDDDDDDEDAAAAAPMVDVD